MSGTLRERALADAGAIARALADLSGPEEWAPSYGREVAASLATGAAGLAVALASLAEAGLVPEAAGHVERLLDFAVEAVASEAIEPDLYGGLAGVGWAAARVWSPSDTPPDEDPLSEVDEEILALLQREKWDGPFDLVGGLVGLGVYALERLPRPTAEASLARIVDHLERTSATDGGLPTWLTAPDWLAPSQRQRAPNGRFDMGVAHGVPGVIGLLAQVCAAGVAADRARPLLGGAVQWLLARRREGPSAFPYYLEPGGESPATRSAWCYGDPGVAAVLLLASRCVDRPEWEREAVSIALRAAARAPQDSGAVDACLCHGAAGLGHLLNRLHQRTGHEELGRAATAWFERTLAMRSQGTGLAGYTTAVNGPDGNRRFEFDPSLLSGAAGTALALAAAATAVEPKWDRMLLLSSAFER